MLVDHDPHMAWHEYMSAGDFEAAWRICDRVPPPVWRGKPLANSAVLIRCENGLGDTIQFLRYARVLQRSGCRVTVAPQPNLASLVGYADGIDAVIANQDATGYDVEIECTELPYALRTTLSNIPDERYIRLPFPPAPGDGRLRIGLVWRSGIYDPRRSVSLRLLAPLAAASQTSWVSLQHGPGLEELRACGSPFGLETSPHPASDDALLTARQILSLDLVITVDTLVAHLAGTLGVPVWTMLPYEADWRWLRSREDSPWYPTMRLFRQDRPGDWTGVVARVKTALERSKA